MLKEGMTNATKAMVRRALAEGGGEKIYVSVSVGKDDVAIKISDSGGGMKRRELEGMWMWVDRGYVASETSEPCNEKRSEALMQR